MTNLRQRIADLVFDAMSEHKDVELAADRILAEVRNSLRDKTALIIESNGMASAGSYRVADRVMALLGS
jgi:hypothetical protein